MLMCIYVASGQKISCVLLLRFIIYVFTALRVLRPIFFFDACGRVSPAQSFLGNSITFSCFFFSFLHL